ncbi:glycerophosphodiester phosphodiesterase [soil metagenome]|jgi:glycerophosphoryl diester phosphodiesterase
MSRPATRGRIRRPTLGPNPVPLIIAHRGASSDVAEHTLPAYLSAIETGADGLECDVRLTRDGHLVCVHDRTVNRTSNGVGVVSDLELSGLQALDFHSWKQQQTDRPLDAERDAAGGGYADTQNADSPYLAGVEPDHLHSEDSQVLTLETLLGVVADAGRPLTMLIETKHPTRYGGLVEKELVRTLRRFGWAVPRSAGPRSGSTVTVMSFAPVALRRVRLLAPQLELVLLMDRTSPIRRDGSLPSGVHTAGPGVKVLRADPGYVERAHAQGNRVYCWTVDETRDVRLAADLGVDAIITNRPAGVLDQLGRR